LIDSPNLRQLASALKVIESVAVAGRVDSTNDIGKAAIDECLGNELELPTSLVVATEQLAGRGRGTNRWHSPPGNLYATLLQSRDRDEVGLVPMEMAVAVAGFLRTSFDIAARIKWPNDIVVKRKKIAGILAEAKTHASRVYLTVGIGINVIPPKDASLNASSLKEELGEAVVLDDVIQRFIFAMDAWLAAPHPAADVLATWRELSAHQHGDSVTAKVGGRVVEGSWNGVDDFGRARIDTAGGIVEIAAGEIVQYE
jgi:BirA family biotin operon repressor/biotin-[acetyl-CoA-carboxylase] ligase